MEEEVKTLKWDYNGKMRLEWEEENRMIRWDYTEKRKLEW